jgi:hypothetical protein
MQKLIHQGWIKLQTMNSKIWNNQNKSLWLCQEKRWLAIKLIDLKKIKVKCR